MRFTAHYINRKAEGKYWRTVYADNIHDATREAEKYVRKGWLLVKVMELK